MNAGKTETVKSICQMCATCCGIVVHKENGVLKKIEGNKDHPLGNICIKPSKGAVAHFYSKDRLIDPLKKKKGGWKKISWEEAFDLISDKLGNIKERYGAKSLALHLGYTHIAAHTVRLAKRFCDLYGTPNITGTSSYCYMGRVIGNGLTFNQDGIMLAPHYSGTHCLILWGGNPTVTVYAAAIAINKLRKRGAKLIVIDPRTIPLAKKADIHIQNRPGTDAALALAFLNVIIEEELYDKEFVDEWTIGFDKLAERVKEFSPKKVEEITWVPEADIRDAARMFAVNKPASVHQGPSLDHCINGAQTSRAISILLGITGNFDIPGGNTYITPLNLEDFRISKFRPKEETVGGKYPLFGKLPNQVTKFAEETTAMPLIDTLITGEPYPIKGLIIQGSNPVLNWPNANKVREGFEKTDLLVDIDIFMTETAKLADVVLPAAAFLEKAWLNDYVFNSIPMLGYTDKVIEPPGRVLPDWKIWAELGKNMGYQEYFPWENDEEVLRDLLAPADITLDQLKKNPDGYFYRPLKRLRYLDEGFNTPSGKMEIYSETMKNLGYDPLPNFREPVESPISNPELALNYPLVLTVGTKTHVYHHSEYHNIQAFKDLVPEPYFEINPHTAEESNIKDNDMATVETPRGKVKMRARVTESIIPGIVSMTHGWDDANANELTNDEALDPITAIPEYRALLCRVVKT